jgi:hypothetical protein
MRARRTVLSNSRCSVCVRRGLHGPRPACDGAAHLQLALQVRLRAESLLGARLVRGPLHRCPRPRRRLHRLLAGDHTRLTPCSPSLSPSAMAVMRSTETPCPPSALPLHSVHSSHCDDADAALCVWAASRPSPTAFAAAPSVSPRSSMRTALHTPHTPWDPTHPSYMRTALHSAHDIHSVLSVDPPLPLHSPSISAALHSSH